MNFTASPESIWEKKTLPILTILLVIFFLLKVIHVSVPLFHDELVYYGRAVFYMLDHGPSMMPGDIDPLLSRGHPLFFVFFVSWLSSWFGTTYIVARVVSLLISLGLIIATYLLGKELGGKKVGLWTVILFCIQPIFFAQSLFILPEVMLALLGILSTLFYLQKRYFLYFIAASLLVLTKESGMVVPAALCLHEWYKDRFRITLGLIGRCFKWAAPLSCFILFLIVQKYQNGWYLFPYHTELMSFSVTEILTRFVNIHVALFLDQGRILLTIASVIGLIKMSKQERVKLFDQYSILVAVFVVMLVFSSLNYLMIRYLMLLFPLVILGMVAVLEQRGYKFKHIIIYFFCTLIFHYSVLLKKFPRDRDMGYLVSIKSTQASIAYLDKIAEGKTLTIYAEYPEICALESPRDGYTKNPNYIVTGVYSDTVDYVLLSDEKFFDLYAWDYINAEHIYKSKLDSILNVPAVFKESNFELIYDKENHHKRHRLYKTNNKINK